MYTLEGTVLKVGETQKVTDSFQKRELVVVDTSGQYEQFISLQMTQANCAKLDNIGEGEKVKVYFNLRGRAWKKDEQSEERYFNSLDAWKIEVLNNEKPKEQAPQSNEVPMDDDGDNVPF